MRLPYISETSVDFWDFCTFLRFLNILWDIVPRARDLWLLAFFLLFSLLLPFHGSNLHSKSSIIKLNKFHRSVGGKISAFLFLTISAFRNTAMAAVKKVFCILFFWGKWKQCITLKLSHWAALDASEIVQLQLRYEFRQTQESFTNIHRHMIYS